MKNKLKNILSKKIFYVILGIIIVGVVEIVYASNLINSKNVSYSNSSSKLSSTNVQGAIDELYNNCKNVKEECPTGQICTKNNTLNYFKTLITLSGDGLYQDIAEPNKLFYRGTNVNNYIKFNNELWRILNINEDGTIKIVKDGYYSTSMEWDKDNSNNWAKPTTLNTELNSTYYNSLSKSSQSMIDTSTWNIGIHTYDDNGTIDENKTQTLYEDISKEKEETWTGKIALFSLSEYVRTNSNNSCLTINNYFSNYPTCKDTTWLYDSTEIQWTISARNIIIISSSESDPYRAWSIKSNGGFGLAVGNELHYAVRPTLVLKSTITITGGDGSSSNPFTIS